MEAHAQGVARAVEARLADGKELWEPSLRQTLWAAIEAPREASVRRWIVETLLERLYSSPEYRTVTKDGFPHVRRKRRTTRATPGRRRAAAKSGRH